MYARTIPLESGSRSSPCEPYLQIIDRVANIASFLLAFDLAFDDQLAGKADLPQSAEELRKGDFALSSRHLAAKLLAIGRIETIFDVNIANIGSDNVQRVDRIALPVHEQVSRIQVDAQIPGANSLDRTQK